MSDLQQAARELLRRRLCQSSFPHFLLYADIPGCPPAQAPPVEMLDALGGPEGLLPAHHHFIATNIQETMARPFGRLMIMAPPGSAKSSLTVAAAAWAMGRWPGEPLIYTSYGSTLAERQSRRIQGACKNPSYRVLWDETPTVEKDSAADWHLSNGSTMYAAGIMAGLTGNRARGAIVDDPVAGREEADSAQIRQKTLDGYQDDLLTRLKPDAWLIFIMTRWHQSDLAGSILPDDYDGRTGYVKCKDGLEWFVISIPAKAERTDDPLGRAPGEYLWPEYMSVQHWHLYEKAEGREAQRRWSSLFQQRPTPDGAGAFTRDMFNWYSPGELPLQLTKLGASDFAVTEGGGDFTEHGVFGLDHGGNLWGLDWWSGQTTTDKSIDAFLDLVVKHQVPYWYNEAGVIDKAVRPAINKRMRERANSGEKCYTTVQSLPSGKDKVAKCQSFQARAASGGVYLPKGAPWAEKLVDQLCALPAGRYDDAADVAGLIGRAIDKVPNASVPAAEKPRGIKPFSVAWLEYEQPRPEAEVRYR